MGCPRGRKAQDPLLEQEGEVALPSTAGLVGRGRGLKPAGLRGAQVNVHTCAGGGPPGGRGRLSPPFIQPSSSSLSGSLVTQGFWG